MWEYEVGVERAVDVRCLIRGGLWSVYSVHSIWLFM